ncbi:uncharacterized protein LOC143260253 [Megalopta genalis]|uniref:uncharacterized protein LOC143260253 n=1 Tax=Megalopta genalis TaxID=115081 RepID=UPI003FD47BC5
MPKVVNSMNWEDVVSSQLFRCMKGGASKHLTLTRPRYSKRKIMKERTQQAAAARKMRTEKIEAAEVSQEMPHFIIEPGTQEQSCAQPIIDEGLTITDFRFVVEQVLLIGYHSATFECTTQHLQVIGMKRSGLLATITLKCKMCQYEAEVHSQTADNKTMDLNYTTTLAAITSGGGYAKMEEMFATMNIPCMSRTEYRRRHDDIVEDLVSLAEAEMLAAAEEEKQLAVRRGDVSVSGIPFIPVVADGSWMKRSYHTGRHDSLSGIGAIAGYHTKKVLFAGVKNKVCLICHNASKRKESPREHRCFKNWGRNETSTRMESAAIAEGFQTSIEKRGLIYNILIADGDSSVYKRILDCDPYKAEMVRVKKIECTNHLLRNFCNKLKDVVKKTPPGIYRKAVKNNIRRLRTDVVKAAVYRSKENLPTHQRIKNLQTDLLNIPSHVFGEHKECRRLGYFCDRPENTGEDNLVPHLKKIGTYNRMHEIFRPLMAHAESLLHNTTNNSVENLNAIIAKYTGGKRLNWGQRGSYSARCAAAVVQHNTQKLISKVIEGKGVKPPKLIEQLEERRKGINEKGNERKRKSPKKVRNPFCSAMDPDYGVSAEKPDMEQHLFSFEKERHMEMLQDWQTNRKKIERDTVEQNKSHEWHTYRSKLLTASNFGKVCRRRKTTKCGNLVKSLLYPNILQLPAIEYGRQCENIAREQLAKEEDVEIRKCGLFIDAEIPFLGATPDGIIDDDGIVEIKCPKTAEKFSPEEAIKNIQPLRRIFEDDAGTALRRTHHYFYQVQGQLHITGRQYCLFCLWTPKGMKTIKVTKDDTFWQNEMKSKLSRFYVHCMLPEILDSRYIRNMSIREATETEYKKPIVISTKLIKKPEANPHNVGLHT